MSQTRRERAGRAALTAVTAIAIVIAVVENWVLYVALTWNLGITIVIVMPCMMGLSYFLFAWLRFRFGDAHWALFASAIAAVVSPWTCLFLMVHATEWSLPTAEGQNVALLFGPLIPYAILAGAGLCKRG